LQAAVTAAKRGHRVILCEASDELGGILKGERALPFKYEMYELGVTLGRQARELGVEIRLNTRVTKEYAEQENPDAVIIAVGSVPIMPPIPGIDGENVIQVTEYHHKKDKVTDSVVALGGGLAGCEIAVHLAREGKTVSLVEMRGELAPDANVRQRPVLLKEIDKCGVKVLTNHKGVRITPEGAVCEHEGKEALVPGTTVICALGQRPNRKEAEELLDTAPFVAQIGDCVKATTITNAVYQGHHAALDI
jgi:NADPH-dependent 2,4-dienoyl-CoA reductase/sulfur reductase-like enzyme